MHKHPMRKHPFSKMTGFFSLAISASLWYTLKIAHMDVAGELSLPGHPLLEWWDGMIILEMGAFLFLVLSFLMPYLVSWQVERKPDSPMSSFGLAWGILFFWQIPFLLAFYPAPGMNDTVYMMHHPLYASVQFPWLYSFVYGYGSNLGIHWWGTGEPVIWFLSLLQLLFMTFGLTRFCFWIKSKYHRYFGWGLYLYFLLCPMVGNYEIAAVRDGLFSLSLLFWVWLFLLQEEQPGWNRNRLLLFTAASLGTMLLRNNGVLVSLLLTAILFYCYGNKKILLIGVLSALLAIVPARIIQETNHWEPLFQESMGIPLQQLGRTLVVEGNRSEETVQLMNDLLEEEKWKKAYLPYTVDFVKWHDDFHRNRLNQEKGKFLASWVETGLSNPRIYVEGWMTETYALWNLDPWEYGVQSRFGWALSDENTKDMKPADNDRMAVGSLPIPMAWKSALCNLQFEGSRFFGSGLCLWLTVFACLLLYHQKKRKYILLALPLLLNTATLLLSTPASSVFRYSFAYVLCLPVIWGVVLLREKQA